MAQADPFANATKQVNDACDVLKIKDKQLREYLAMPNRVLRVKIPVKMDNGKIRSLLDLDHSITMTVVHTKEAYDTLIRKAVSNTWNAKSWHYHHG